MIHQKQKIYTNKKRERTNGSNKYLYIYIYE